MFVHLLIAALASMMAVHWIFLKILKIAKVKGLVDNPDARKLQKTPVPVLGGIAVFFGLLFGLLVFACMHMNVLNGITPVLIGASIMLYVGSLDDITGLSPRARLGIEVAVMLGVIASTGMCVDSFHGLWGLYDLPSWVAVPMTVFAGVGIINAYNMVDGVNGLSSGLCIASSCLLGTIFFSRGDWSDTVLAFCFAGALVPFYIHNVFGKRSKMFIGDAGTMVMGFLVSWFIIRVLSSSNGIVTEPSEQGNIMCLVAMMLAVASVPVFDTLRVMGMRMVKGGSPFKADKTHLHHIFIASGVSHLVTSLSEILINVLIFALWLLGYKCGLSQEGQLYLVIAVSVILVWGTYLFLSYQEKHNTDMFVKFNEMSRATHWGSKQWWKRIQSIVDRGAYESPKN